MPSRLLSLRHAVFYPVLVIAYVLAMARGPGLRPEHLLCLAVVLSLCAIGPRTRRAMDLLLPFFLLGAFYDLQWLIEPRLHASIHVARPFFRERWLFGIPLGDHRDPHARASAAAALRFDRILGVHYFRDLYARSADVFGSMPSLHVAGPLLAFLYIRQLGQRGLSIAAGLFWILVCFAAIYLQHHYVQDVIAGCAYALTGYAIERSVSLLLRRADTDLAATV